MLTLGTSSLPAPVVQVYNGITVVRDDLIAGGTKRRVIPLLFDGHGEYVYASPCQGYAQVALAYAASSYGKHATIFCAKRGKWHPRTEEAYNAGAAIHEVPYGYLSVVRKRASAYALSRNAKLLPWGLDVPIIINAIASIAKGLNISPFEVWTVAGSGTLSRALQKAWPTAEFFAVQIGAKPNAGKAVMVKAPENFNDAAKEPPGFPSCPNYDAKAWRFISRQASEGALFWNVAG